MYKNVSVIGAGRWGTFLAYYLANYCINEVLLYGRSTSEDFSQLLKERKNNYLNLTDNINLTSDLNFALKSDLIVISIGCQNLRGLAKELNNYDLNSKKFVLAMKGLEQNTCKRMSEIMFEEIKQDIDVAVLLGPGHVQDYIKKIPSCAVVDSENENFKKELAGFLNSNLMRVYYGDDLIGNEVGAALKNVIGIAAGVLDGFGWYGLKGALMTRGAMEVARIIEFFGGKGRSAYGLAHLGDYEATLFSANSHNRMFGECLAKNKSFDKLAEGYFTLKAIDSLSKKNGLYLPICTALYEFVYEKKDIDCLMRNMFNRDVKREFD